MDDMMVIRCKERCNVHNSDDVTKLMVKEALCWDKAYRWFFFCILYESNS